LPDAPTRPLRGAIQDACGPVTPGAVSVIHTAGNFLDYHPHTHLIITWGGWLESGLFVHAPPLPDDVLEKLFKHRVFRMLLDEEAVSQDVVESMLQWPHSGFDAFTGPAIPGDDTDGLENLAQYISKGPVSLQNLEYSEQNHEACYRSDKIHPRHGPYRSFDPLEFLAELAAHIAQPYEKLTKTHGFYSNASRGKRRKMQEISQVPSVPPQIELSAPEPPSRKNWARLINKVYEIDPLVCQCGGKLKPIALIEDPDVIYRILKHCNLLETDAEQEPRAPPQSILDISFQQVSGKETAFVWHSCAQCKARRNLTSSF
jgi:hypothetical protein